MIDGRPVTLIALPLIFDQLRQAGKSPTQETVRELLETVKIYNPVPAETEEDYSKAILRAYTAFLEKKETR
jgi:hypothetical protein